MKKLAIVPLSAALMFLASSGVSAANYNGGWPSSGGSETKLNNAAYISQEIVGLADTGGNTQNDWAKAYHIKYSGVEAGSYGTRWISSGDAKVGIHQENWANINEGGQQGLNSFSLQHHHGSKPSVELTINNRAKVYQSIVGQAWTGDNSQNNSAQLKSSWKSGVAAGGGDRGIATGMAEVGIVSVNKVNFNLQ